MLGALGTAAVWGGDFAAAASLIAEADAVCEATGSRAAAFAAMMLACLRGDQAEAAPLIEATIAQATTGGQGIAVAYAHWVAAILANGLACYDEALAAARHASEDTFNAPYLMWALPELVEAAARTGNTHVARGALEQLAETTQAGGTDFGLGLESRCRALLSGGTAARTGRPGGLAEGLSDNGRRRRAQPQRRHPVAGPHGTRWAHHPDGQHHRPPPVRRLADPFRTTAVRAGLARTRRRDRALLRPALAPRDISELARILDSLIQANEKHDQPG
jgi:hypothetical protein